MRWFHKTSSKTPTTTTTTSHKQPATSPPSSSSYYQTASASTSTNDTNHTYSNATYYQTANKSYTHKYPDTSTNHTYSNLPLTRREMWTCCHCGFRRNHHNPNRGWDRAQCGNTFANKERAVGDKRCEHEGPCDQCDKEPQIY